MGEEYKLLWGDQEIRQTDGWTERWMGQDRYVIKTIQQNGDSEPMWWVYLFVLYNSFKFSVCLKF